jgi:carboxymethylenebutenolidase
MEKEESMSIVRLLRALFFMMHAGVALWFGSSPATAADAMQVKVGVGQKMEATLYKPPGAGPFPAVLVLHTSGGLRPPDHAYASRLADEGYVCLVPDFFTPYGLSQVNRQQTFTTHAQAIYADFVAAIDVLKKMKEVQADRIGAVGFSNGGYWALLLAARGDVQAGVSYYGAVNGAGTDNMLNAFRSAFTSKSSAVLVLHGAGDTTVSPQHADNLKSILTDAKAPHEFQLYASAGHSYDRGKQPDSNATNDSWQRTLRFLDKTLRK